MQNDEIYGLNAYESPERKKCTMAEEKQSLTRIYHLRGDIENTTEPFLVNTIGETYNMNKFENGFVRGRNDYYMMCMTSGVLNARIGDEQVLLEPNKFFIIPPRTYIWYDCYESPDPIKYFTIHVTGYDVENVLKKCGLPIGKLTDVHITRSLIYHFENVLALFPARGNDFDFKLGAMVQSFLIMLANNIVLEDNAIEARIDRSIKYIHDHINEPLSVKELAEMEFFSPSRYRAIFKNATGSSPVEYITEQRIRLACALLEHGDLTLSQVAETCGYTDRLYFQRVFKRHINMTPGEYKAKFH